MKGHMPIAAAVLLAACSGSRNEQREDTLASAASGASSCPATVPGTTVRAEETGDGVAMVFTTSDPASVTELRRSVALMAREIETGTAGDTGGEVRTGMPGAGAAGADGSTESGTPDHGSMAEGNMGAGMDHGAMGEGSMDGSMHEGHASHGAMMSLPQAQASLTSIDGGSRLELKATDPAQLDQLRAGVRRHIEAMQAGSCAMGGKG